MGERMGADLPDRLIQPPQGLADPGPRYLAGLIGGGVQAQSDVVQAAGHPVQQFLRALFLPVGGRHVD